MSNQEKQAKKSFFKKHKLLTAILTIVVLIIICVAISSGGKSSNTTVTTTASSKSSGTSNKSSSPAAAKVGSTINVGGSKGLGVTLKQIIDPASGADQYTTADAGKRFVAADLTIVNNGTSSYTDDANSDVTLIGSDNQTYTADFDSVSECTNFNSGQYTLAAGQSTTGCVVFQVPDSVTTSKIEFQVQSGLNTETGEWTN